MGMTMTQKILAAHAGLESVVPGQLIEADLDLVLANDITGPVAIHEAEKLNKKTVFDKDKIALVIRIILHRIKILNQQNTANVYANMQKHRELQIILKLARWELSMPFCRKKV